MACGFDPTDDFGDVADFQQEVTLMRPGTSDAWALSRAVRAAIRASEARASQAGSPRTTSSGTSTGRNWKRHRGRAT